MPFANRIRLPLYLSRPQFPARSNVFRLANGKLKVLSAVVRKTYEGQTDYMPESWHEKLRIALMHDHVAIEGNKMVGSVALEGEGYQIDWQKFLNYPTAQANFVIQVGDYDFTNDNCQTCQEASQLALVDDYFTSASEGGSVTGNVLANDTVFCTPAVLSITVVNSSYVQSHSLDQAGNIILNLRATTPTMAGVLLATYRVTCPSGSYDEADVYADITGSEEACQVPQNVHDIALPGQTTHSIEWDDSTPPQGYFWEVYKEANLGSIFQSGQTASPNVSLTGLDPCTDYRFFVKAKCDDEIESPFAEITFSTDCPEAGCGFYELYLDDGSGDTNAFRNVSYFDCNGAQQIVPVYNLTPRFICALENTPGDPVRILGPTTNTYIEPC